MALRSIPPGHQLGDNIWHVAGAHVLFWQTCSSWGSMGQAPWTVLEGFPLITAGGCGHCSLGRQFGSDYMNKLVVTCSLLWWEGEPLDVFIFWFITISGLVVPGCLASLLSYLPASETCPDSCARAFQDAFWDSCVSCPFQEDDRLIGRSIDIGTNNSVIPSLKYIYISILNLKLTLFHLGF